MMTWLKGLIRAKMLSWTLAFIVTSFLLFPLFPVSQNNTLTHRLIPVAHAQDIVSVFKQLLERTGLYSPPQRGTAPIGRRVGGAGRGPICALTQIDPDDRDRQTELNQSVTALVALQTTEDEEQLQQTDLDADVGAVGGLTLEAQPTFWFYLPYISTPETPPNRIVAQFVLLDETEHPVWNELMSVDLLENPRLVEYLLPYTLETDKLYSWYFSVICDAEKLSKNPVVRGWVQRIEPTEELQTALKNAPLFEQYMVYAENGIWFDTVNSLVKTQRQFSIINRSTWRNLLAYFHIPDNQLYLESAEPTDREEIKGNQLPTKM
ncbi:MAG: DUF928 domain-containing protein [Xenococcaceae cyanobacterium MO_188.B29]|nr:DUF928 domain-containing protein [Xenococcaceae cyanobacterium MO_188.B29]